MKKLLVVLAALTLVFGFAVSAMADASFSGDFNFGFATLFDSEKDQVGWGDLELNFEFTPDDYNTVVIETNYEAATLNVTPTGIPVSIPVDFGPVTTFWIDTAKLDTDLGAFFGLPIGLVHSAGWHEPGGESYPDETTGFEFEDQTKDSIGEGTTAIGLEANYNDMAIIDVAFSVAQGTQGDLVDPLDPATGAWDAYFGVAMPDIADMVSAEAYYAIQDSSEFKGYFGVDAQAAISMVTAGASFTFATTDDVLWDFLYGVGASAEIEPAKIGVSLTGNSEDILDLLGVDANVAFGDFGLDAGLALGVYDGAETLQHFDISGYAAVGTATVRLGYVMTDTTKAVKDPDYKAPAILADGKGGVYFNVGTEF
jgi:hypothetical protein